ncbi:MULTISPECIES: hypothetical protein [Kitasatospora]|uniref:Transmembrane protein n=1 Tax=Kitasatospora cystarginea TaxID=58350 RepID=A0ABN3EP85_9ACTN
MSAPLPMPSAWPWTTLAQLALAQQRASRSSAEADADLSAIVAKACPAAKSCGIHLAQATSSLASGSETVGTGQAGHQQAQDEAVFRSGVADADASSTERLALLLLLTVTGTAAAAFALNPRIDEYRFGSR